MNKVAFIITTFMRDSLLFNSVESLLPYLQENQYIMIVDQGNSSEEKSKLLDDKRISYHLVPFDSGLSYCRNYGVQIAKLLECDYVFMGSDSFIFNENILRLKEWLYNKLYNFDILGFELRPSKCGWEAKLNLIDEKSFELDFIDKQNNFYFLELRCPLWAVDIMRNCFVAKTEVLLNVKWDENFKLGEHEDFFWRVKQAGYNCGWTSDIILTKQTDRSNKYAQLRKKNFDDGIRYLRKKYNISGWVSYKNLENAKQFIYNNCKRSV